VGASIVVFRQLLLAPHRDWPPVVLEEDVEVEVLRVVVAELELEVELDVEVEAEVEVEVEVELVDDVIAAASDVEAASVDA